MVHVVHPYSSIDMTDAWKKLRFILSVRSDFYMTARLSVAVHAFVSRVLKSFAFDVTLKTFPKINPDGLPLPVSARLEKKQYLLPTMAHLKPNMSL